MHTLICGVTRTGKTTLAREIERGLSAKGHRTIVYDPMGTETKGGGWSEAADEYNDPDEFFAAMREHDGSDAFVFIDESGELFGVGDKENHWLLTRGRHKGLSVFLISQRPKMLAPTVRTQCGRGYLFRMSRDDTREILADFGHSGYGPNLKKGEYLILDSGSPEVYQANVFTRRPSRLVEIE